VGCSKYGLFVRSNNYCPLPNGEGEMEGMPFTVGLTPYAIICRTYSALVRALIKLVSFFEAILSTLPIKQMLEEIEEAGVEAKISNSAGTYVCNTAFYSALDSIWLKSQFSH